MTFASFVRGLAESRLYRRALEFADFVTYREVREMRFAPPAAAEPAARSTRGS